MQFPKNSSWAGRTTSSPRKWQCWNLSHYLFGRTWRKKMSILKLAAGSCCNSLVFSDHSVHSPVCSQLKGRRWHPPTCGLEQHAPRRHMKKSVLLISSCREIEIFLFSLEHPLSIFWVHPVTLMPWGKKKKIWTIWHLILYGISFSLPSIWLTGEIWVLFTLVWYFHLMW